MDSLSFDNMVDIYDKTRVFDRHCFNSALDYLVERFPSAEYSDVLEPGVGTGRIAIPLAKRGYRVTGIDISEEMLAVLRERLKRSRKFLQISLQKADVIGLPFPNASFDMAIAVHLFYFIKEWRKAVDEILRVVSDNGSVILMHTGMGAEIPFLNSRYKELCAEQDCPIESIGVRSTSEVIDYLIYLGCRIEEIKDRWRWTSRISMDEAISYISSRAYSFSTFASDDVHYTAIRKLKTELIDRFGTLATKVEVPNQIYFVFIRK